MELDSCGNESNFYDEIASLMPQPGDYSLDDIDEILRSTDSQLDSSLDLNDLLPPYENFLHTQQQQQQQQTTSSQQQLYDDFKFNSTYGSPATTGYSTGTRTYNSQRTSSISSMDEDNFNPDEFINFLNDDGIKVEEVTPENIMNMPHRNTPSPTGSCTSSSGSSTSGVQSDASSVASMSQTYAEGSPSMLNLKQEEDCEAGMFLEVPHIINESAYLTAAPQSAVSIAAPTVNMTMPLISMQATGASPTLMQPVNVLPGTLIPVKTVPLTAVTSMPPVKIEPKLAPKAKVITPVAASALKIVTPSATTPASKLTPPPNAKPKTIFLSSNDFKALMQKMNSNGGGKGAKISGGLSGQVPKIIMKTANGKMITANKLVQAQAGGSNFAPKMVKTNAGPLVIKQQPNKLVTHTTTNATLAAANVAVARANATSHLSIYKGMIDEKMMKKQQRMIKNRESASLSRKKKKEYVVSLESRIHDLEKENCTLKGENTSLRSQLVALAQTCHCKNTNISEFVLNSLNVNSTSGNQHVKIAPKPASRSMKQRLLAANVKKNVAVLFAMAFMVTLNVGNFQNYLNKNTLESAAIEAVEEPMAASGRRLLWVETESEFKSKLNRSKREVELEVPPLHFLQPHENRTRAANSTEPVPPQPPTAEGCASSSSTTTTTTSTNQTENLRLASNLHKWIDGNDYLNLSLREKFGNADLDMGFKLSNSDFGGYNMKTIDLPLQAPIQASATDMGKQKRKIIIERATPYANKQRKFEPGKNSGLDLFKPTLSDEYVRLFKGIKRQDDTFYVLSFNMDHILLPASAYNKSARPKMSLMLPAGDPTENGDIVLMQIDCEVVNTTELALKAHMIPEKLRPLKYGPSPNANDVANNETKTQAEKLPKTVHAAMMEEDGAKVKPTVKTYFMVGPKMQEATAALKKKPTIVKLSSNASLNVVGLNVKNSTLFAKMRETVEGEFK